MSCCSGVSMSGRSRRGRARGGGRSLGRGPRRTRVGWSGAWRELRRGGQAAAAGCWLLRAVQGSASARACARPGQASMGASLSPSPPSPSLRPLLPSHRVSHCRCIGGPIVAHRSQAQPYTPCPSLPKTIPRVERPPPPPLPPVQGFPLPRCNSLATSVHPAQPPLLQTYNPYSNPPAAPPLVGWPRAVHTARLNPEMSGLAFILEYVWRRRLDGRGLRVDCDCDRTDLHFVVGAAERRHHQRLISQCPRAPCVASPLGMTSS
ncbi:hypothetical protein BGZ57DRAFT_426919 [Hyaloscypha finlandica]|nr:hypothetical protein BGZ57DRAFT_426919 [Hyaloscypha finlandica]